MSTGLPDCGYRVQKKELYCLHPKVLAPEHKVTANQCLRCTTWVSHKEPPRALTDPAPLAPGPATPRQKHIRWLLAVAKYWEHGSPKATPEEYAERLAICQSCELCVDDHCTHPRCGCKLTGKRPLRNKLRMATEQCPKSPPLWNKIPREGSKRKKAMAAMFRGIAKVLQNTVG